MRTTFYKALFVASLLSATQLYAQQEPQYTQYMFNQLLFNPAYAGARDGLCAGLMYHNQWGGFEGIRSEKPPRTLGAYVHSSIGLGTNQRLGLGAHLMTDEEGFLSTTQFAADVAYRRQLSFAELAIGLNVGMTQKGITPDWVSADPSDPRLPGETSGAALDLGAGVWLQNEKYYAGISSLHINSPNIAWDKADYEQVAVYYLTAGYNYRGGFLPRSLELQPSFLLKQDIVKTQLDLNVMALYQERFTGGITYRTQDAVAAIAGAYFNIAGGQGLLSYSYDITTSALAGTGGVHEISFRYCRNISIPPTNIHPPRDTRYL